MTPINVPTIHILFLEKSIFKDSQEFTLFQWLLYWNDSLEFDGRWRFLKPIF